MGFVRLSETVTHYTERHQSVRKYIKRSTRSYYSFDKSCLCTRGNCLEPHEGHTLLVVEKTFKVKIRLTLHTALYLANSSNREFLIPEQAYFLLKVVITHFICGADDYVAAFQ